MESCTVVRLERISRHAGMRRPHPLRRIQGHSEGQKQQHVYDRSTFLESWQGIIISRNAGLRKGVLQCVEPAQNDHLPSIFKSVNLVIFRVVFENGGEMTKADSRGEQPNKAGFVGCVDSSDKELPQNIGVVGRRHEEKICCRRR